MHNGMPYGRIQGQGQGHSMEVDRQSPTGLIFSEGIALSGALESVHFHCQVVPQFLCGQNLRKPPKLE